MKFLYKGVKVSQLQRSFNKFLTRPILWSVYKSFIESSKPICGCFIELSSVKHVWVLILTLGLFFFVATFVFLEENNLYILFDNAPVEYNILIFFLIIILDLFLFTCMEAKTGPQLFTFEAC